MTSARHQPQFGYAHFSITQIQENIVSRTVKLAVELTKGEARALQRAIDDYFESCGMTDSVASDCIERMHSKVSDALIAGGRHCDDSDATSLFWN